MRGLPVGRRLVATVVGLAALAAPAAASAATLSVNRPCYDIVNGKGAPMLITGSGFYPGDSFVVTSSDGTVAAPVTVDANGNVAATVASPAPFFADPGQKSVTLSADDVTPTGAQIQATSAPFLVAPLMVTTRPSSARLSARVTWMFSGFRRGRMVYGHYLHGRRHHQVARTRFGRARGACGLLKSRDRFFPGGHPRYGRYLLQVDDSRRYRGRRANPRVLLSIVKFIL